MTTRNFTAVSVYWKVWSTVRHLVAIGLLALCAQSCRTRSEVARNIQTGLFEQDSLASVIRGMMTMPVAKEEVRLTIPTASLLELPPSSSFHKRNGRADVEVKREGDSIVVEASCDSLQRLVWWYEAELTRIRIENREKEETLQAEVKQGINPIKTGIISFIAGFVAGIVTIIIKRRRQ